MEGSVDTTVSFVAAHAGMHGMALREYAVMTRLPDHDRGALDDRVAGKGPGVCTQARFLAHIDIDAAEIGKGQIGHLVPRGFGGRKRSPTWYRGEKASRKISEMAFALENLKKQHVATMTGEFQDSAARSAGVPERNTRGEAIVCTESASIRCGGQYLTQKIRALRLGLDGEPMGFGLRQHRRPGAMPDRSSSTPDGAAACA